MSTSLSSPFGAVVTGGVVVVGAVVTTVATVVTGAVVVAGSWVVAGEVVAAGAAVVAGVVVAGAMVVVTVVSVAVVLVFPRRSQDARRKTESASRRRIKKEKECFILNTSNVFSHYTLFSHSCQVGGTEEHFGLLGSFFGISFYLAFCGLPWYNKEKNSGDSYADRE